MQIRRHANTQQRSGGKTRLTNRKNNNGNRRLKEGFMNIAWFLLSIVGDFSLRTVYVESGAAFLFHKPDSNRLAQ